MAFEESSKCGRGYHVHAPHEHEHNGTNRRRIGELGDNRTCGSESSGPNGKPKRSVTVGGDTPHAERVGSCGRPGRTVIPGMSGARCRFNEGTGCFQGQDASFCKSVLESVLGICLW